VFARSGSHRILSLYLISSAMLLPAAAQTYAPNEITAGATLQTYASDQECLLGSGGQCQYSFSPSVSFTYSRNLSRSVALEGTYQPASYFMYNDLWDSGREELALGGIKAGWRGRRWGLYGKLDAGVASFSCAVWSYGTNAGQQRTGWNACQRLTHFALEYGGVAEYHKNARYTLRFDAGHLMVAEFDQNLLGPMIDGYDLNARWGGLFSHLDMRLGVTRNFGRTETASAERAPENQKWDTGAIFALQPRTEPYFTNGFLNPYPEEGLWASWNFSKHVSWDTTLLRSPRNPGKNVNDSYQAGGRAFEALSGVKAGFRSGHMGYFAKARPGLMTFGETYRGRTDFPCRRRRLLEPCFGTSKVDNGTFTDAVLDTGGIVEFYPTRRSVLRFEAGSATVFYLSKSIFVAGFDAPPGGFFEPIPRVTAPSMLMAFGAGFRF